MDKPDVTLINGDVNTNCSTCSLLHSISSVQLHRQNRRHACDADDLREDLPPHGLLFISMRDNDDNAGAFSDSRYCTILQHFVVIVRLMTTTVYLLGQNRARHNDNKPGALSNSRCHTTLQYLTYKTFCLERMMLAYTFWLVQHLPFSTALDVRVGNYCSYSSATALLNSSVTLRNLCWFSLIMGGYFLM